MRQSDDRLINQSCGNRQMRPKCACCCWNENGDSWGCAFLTPLVLNRQPEFYNYWLVANSKPDDFDQPTPNQMIPNNNNNNTKPATDVTLRVKQARAPLSLYFLWSHQPTRGVYFRTVEAEIQLFFSATAYTCTWPQSSQRSRLTPRLVAKIRASENKTKLPNRVDVAS